MLCSVTSVVVVRVLVLSDGFTLFSFDFALQNAMLSSGGPPKLCALCCNQVSLHPLGRMLLGDTGLKTNANNWTGAQHTHAHTLWTSRCNTNPLGHPGVSGLQCCGVSASAVHLCNSIGTDTNPSRQCSTCQVVGCDRQDTARFCALCSCAGVSANIVREFVSVLSRNLLDQGKK